MKMKGAIVTEDTWSPDAKELAWTPGPWGPEHGAFVYVASKVEQEQAVWKYHEENKSKRPDLVVNSGKKSLQCELLCFSVSDTNCHISPAQHEPGKES